jgi:hypothetical protein
MKLPYVKPELTELYDLRKAYNMPSKFGDPPGPTTTPQNNPHAVFTDPPPAGGNKPGKVFTDPDPEMARMTPEERRARLLTPKHPAGETVEASDATVITREGKEVIPAPAPAAPSKPYVESGLPFKRGENVYLRTVAMTVIGRVTEYTKDYAVLDSVVQVGGLLSDALKTGVVPEAIAIPTGWILSMRSSWVDCFPWKYPIPAETTRIQPTQASGGAIDGRGDTKATQTPTPS